jgi:hypothetical protein
LCHVVVDPSKWDESCSNDERSTEPGAEEDASPLDA